MVVRDVGRFEIRLLPNEAPLNAWRFLRLARQGFYEDLTFHRVVPNFVIQGGSPGANEYMGDGPYTRDEVGMQSNLRGTLGVSTRGRDTGDGQIYVNLVDNLRLDHTYTVFAQVERGEDVIDAILEGDVIEDVQVMGGK
jgi:cyclophilin family peptidyl-prolyl cis-trans isomerase